MMQQMLDCLQKKKNIRFAKAIPTISNHRSFYALVDVSRHWAIKAKWKQGTKFFRTRMSQKF